LSLPSHFLHPFVTGATVLIEHFEMTGAHFPIMP